MEKYKADTLGGLCKEVEHTDEREIRIHILTHLLSGHQGCR